MRSVILAIGCALLSVSLTAAADWKVIKRKDVMTDVVTLQGFSGEARSLDSTRAGGLFFDCAADVLVISLFAEFFDFSDTDTGMMRVDDHDPISIESLGRIKSASDNRLFMMFLDAADAAAQEFVAEVRGGNSLAVRVRSERGRSITFRFRLDGSNAAFGEVLEWCGLPKMYPEGYAP